MTIVKRFFGSSVHLCSNGSKSSPGVAYPQIVRKCKELGISVIYRNTNGFSNLDGVKTSSSGMQVLGDNQPSSSKTEEKFLNLYSKVAKKAISAGNYQKNTTIVPKTAPDIMEIDIIKRKDSSSGK